MNECTYCHFDIDTQEDGWGFYEVLPELWVKYHQECIEMNEGVTV